MKTDKILNFTELLKRAWKHVWGFKYLWLLGLLAGGGAGASNNFSSFSDNSFNTKDLKGLDGKPLADSMPSFDNFLEFFKSSESISLIIIIAAGIIVFSLIQIYLNVTARGAIISAVNKLDEEKKIGLGESWHLGHKYFWRIFGFSILYCLIIFVPLLFLALPVVIMAAVRWYIPAVIVGFLFLLIFIVYAIYISVSIQYAERILILENKRAWDSIKLGTQFINKNWRNVILTYLVLLAIMIVAGIVLAIGILLVGGILFGATIGLYFINSIAAIVVAIPLALAFLVALLVVNGLLSSYQSTLLTLAYREIKD